MAGSTSFSDQTVRNIIYTSVGGHSLRVQLSNTFGSAPLQVGAVSVGVVLNGSQLLPGTSRTVTFGGKTSVTIPAGAQEASDPVTFHVQPLTELAVSVYLPDATGGATNHSDAQQNNYIASGNHVSDSTPTAYTSTTGSWYFVDGLDVYSKTADGTVVAFGDSITDGYLSLTGANARWPNYLARSLNAASGDRAPGVVDEGISGNRILSDSTCFGVNALSRFERDALSQPGVKTVIFLEGINDIGFAGMPDSGCSEPNNPDVTAGQSKPDTRPSSRKRTPRASRSTRARSCRSWGQQRRRRVLRHSVRRAVARTGQHVDSDPPRIRRRDQLREDHGGPVQLAVHQPGVLSQLRVGQHGRRPAPE